VLLLLLLLLSPGIPQTDMLRIYEGYVTSFDLRTRNPKWVLEFISSETLKGEGTR
jgi:endonuclease G